MTAAKPLQTVQFVDVLPGATNGPNSRRWRAVREQLRAKPGVWALILPGSNRNTAATINRGDGLWGPKGTFEATSRKSTSTPGRYDVYARFTGEATT